MVLSRRQKALFLLIGIVLSVIIPIGLVGAEDFLGSFWVAQSSIHLNATNGPEVITTQNYELQSGNPFTENSVNLSTQNNGWVNLSSTGSTVVTVDQINGTWTNVSGLDVSSNGLTIDPDDKQAATISADAETFGYKDTMTLDDGEVDFHYGGTSGTTNITLRGLSSNTLIGAVDVDSGSVLDVSTSDGSGTIEFEGMPNSDHNVALETGTAPSINNSSASPDGGVSTASPTLSINVSDADFGVGDEVTVEFFLDGNSVGTDTLTSNGTATHSTTSLTGGDHTWNVTATDDYGLSTTSQDFTVSIPANITFRNESNADELVPVDVEITFIGSDTIVERSGTENVSLEGLPVDEKMVVVVEADGWTDRTIILDDIFQQSDVYLLNESLTTTTVVFTVEDRTGLFSTGDAELIVERIINQSSSPEWRRVQAEKSTDAGIVVTMERDKRYRLKIRSDDGSAIADLGHITAAAEFDGTTVNLVVTSTEGDLTEVGGLYAWNTTYEVRDSQADRIRFDFEVIDSDFDADDVLLTIHEQGNESNEIYNQSHGDDVTDLLVFQTVPNDESTWVVQWSATINGEDYSAMRLVGDRRGALGDGLCGGDLDQVWCERITIGGMFVIAGLFSTFNIGVGAFILGTYAGVAWYFGMLPTAIGAGAILLALAVSIGWVMAKGGAR